MTGTPPTKEIVIETHGRSGARALAGTVCDLYEAVFSLPPFNGNAAEFANQRRYFPGLLDRPGFRLTTARSGPDFVGFGYGYLLPPDTGWWSRLADPVDEEFATETGTRTFAFIDYGVLPGSRGAGIGRRIHDELLGGSGAERATLSVQPAAARTQEIYRGWGWRKVSRKLMDPPIPAPVFDVLVLERMPPARRS
ncbi:GNAT family N-acetyltransferase [Streptosporangium sp. NPDC023615]|uniref:GNAT family N-acetyltransferase n=1 Tax=Streptosporangium sp. NPDC023615 TaxID=3154794 RepID=UPI003446B823